MKHVADFGCDVLLGNRHHRGLSHCKLPWGKRP
jgi:hypothetical protein